MRSATKQIGQKTRPIPTHQWYKRALSDQFFPHYL